MSYINTVTLAYPVLLSDLCRAFPHISFPATGPDADTLTALDYAAVAAVEPPIVAENQTVVEGPPELADGGWRQTWVVGEMAAEAYAAKVQVAKAAACANIDARAEELRAEVLTQGSGQVMEYYQTHAEAVNYLAAVAAGQTLAEANYPFLQAEQAALVATTGSVRLADVATAVMADVNASKAALAAIKQARRTGKLVVGAATDRAGVAAAEATVVWPPSCQSN